MTLDTWILIFAIVAAIAASVSAVTAITSIRRRPKLRVNYTKSLVGGKGQGIPTDKEQFGGTLDVWVSNLGRATARNVVGWLRFDPRRLEPIYNDTADAYVVTLPATTLRPCSEKHKDSDDWRFGCEAHMHIPVLIRSSGSSEVGYYFVSEEGTEARGELQIEI